MADITSVAKAFVEFYYQTFDSGRQQLAPLYRNDSMLTFEGQQFAGSANITEKLVSLPFQKVSHRISTTDAQPANPGNGAILVTVTGQLLFDEEQNPQFFTQTFTLIPENNSYWVYNDVFRLVFA
ncbi:nuclear transport factor 2 [Hesseltinella vesiculosa]|uniref:Nuclear transport factor 2 n=1 Tax=Hesseltinella vesiculosa TaxID=101127 RepID=A0A1X2GDF6_9FUNG|nr:nuclear transport factor 2 [Hesseltinella vesiculosa]